MSIAAHLASRRLARSLRPGLTQGLCGSLEFTLDAILSGSLV
jgi:hypothetical protein